MLSFAGEKRGMDIHILSQKSDDPAAQVSGNWKKGNPHRFEDIKAFAKNVDFLTFESEFIDATLLMKLQKVNKKLQIFPRPSALNLLQDRKSQKTLFDLNGIPTARWLSFAEGLSPKNIGDLLWDFFPKGFVLKQRRNGYDGYGTFVCRSQKDFLKIAASLHLPLNQFIAEEFIPFRRELAVMAGRTKTGNTFSYPLVETSQVNSQCDWVRGPY
ncbi:MAG: ATP-grasp domain-containing protein, partial [Bdellovibrionota bacterium]